MTTKRLMQSLGCYLLIDGRRIEDFLNAGCLVRNLKTHDPDGANTFHTFEVSVARGRKCWFTFGSHRRPALA